MYVVIAASLIFRQSPLGTNIHCRVLVFLFCRDFLRLGRSRRRVCVVDVMPHCTHKTQRYSGSTTSRHCEFVGVRILHYHGLRRRRYQCKSRVTIFLMPFVESAGSWFDPLPGCDWLSSLCWWTMGFPSAWNSMVCDAVRSHRRYM
jgi:hypothetical protein